MGYELELPFEELGLPLPDGFVYGNYEGIFTVTYDDCGDWSITNVEVEKRKLVNGKWLSRPHSLNVKNLDERAAYHNLCSVLEVSYAGTIKDAVAEALREHEPLIYTSSISAGRTFA